MPYATTPTSRRLPLQSTTVSCLSRPLQLACKSPASRPSRYSSRWARPCWWQGFQSVFNPAPWPHPNQVTYLPLPCRNDAELVPAGGGAGGGAGVPAGGAGGVQEAQRVAGAAG